MFRVLPALNIDSHIQAGHEPIDSALARFKSPQIPSIPSVSHQYPSNSPLLKRWTNRQELEAGSESSATQVVTAQSAWYSSRLYEVVQTEMKDRACNGSKIGYTLHAFYIVSLKWPCGSLKERVVWSGTPGTTVTSTWGFASSIPQPLGSNQSPESGE